MSCFWAGVELLLNRFAEEEEEEEEVVAGGGGGIGPTSSSESSSAVGGAGGPGLEDGDDLDRFSPARGGGETELDADREDVAEVMYGV